MPTNFEGFVPFSLPPVQPGTRPQRSWRSWRSWEFPGSCSLASDFFTCVMMSRTFPSSSAENDVRRVQRFNKDYVQRSKHGTENGLALSSGLSSWNGHKVGTVWVYPIFYMWSSRFESQIPTVISCTIVSARTKFILRQSQPARRHRSRNFSFEDEINTQLMAVLPSGYLTWPWKIHPFLI